MPLYFYNESKSMEKENLIEDITNSEYKYGFVTDIETDVIKKGEDVVRYISGEDEECRCGCWSLGWRHTGNGLL